MTAIELDRSPRRGDTFRLEIDELGPKGRGRGKIVAEVGPQRQTFTYTFVVRMAVPGDVVEAKVQRRKKRRVEAEVDRYVERSPMRIEPRCEHFGLRTIEGKGCGGCALQSLSYRHQLTIKEKRVKRLFANSGFDPGLVLPTEGIDDPWYYRNKMEFSFGDGADRQFAFGMHPAGYRYEVLNLDACYLQSEFVSALLPKIRDWADRNGLQPFQHHEGFLRTCVMREGKRTGERMIELVTTHHDEALWRGGSAEPSVIAEDFRDFAIEASTALGQRFDSIYWTQHRAVRGERTVMIEHLLDGNEVLHEELHLPGDHVLRFEIHPRAFFQPSTRGAELIYAHVVEAAGLEKGSNKTVLDLYSGTGTIGMSLSPYADEVVGVELQQNAVQNARRNAALNRLDNVEFHCGDVGDVLEEEELDGDVVVVDPPRSGLLPETRRHLQDISAERMVYVSCNPSALVRDLRKLTEHGWSIDSAQPIDQFPHTYHIEVVVGLSR